MTGSATATTPPGDRSLRRAGLVTVAVALLVFFASSAFMVLRVQEHYRLNPPPNWLMQELIVRKFYAFGDDTKPVTLTDRKLPAESLTPGALSGHALEIDYAGNKLLVPVHAPPVFGYQDLTPYDEWLAVLAIGPLEQGQLKLDPAASQTRLVLVKRNVEPGRDDQMGGIVGSKLWTFDLIEFKRDGTLDSKRVQFRDRRTGKLPAAAGDPDIQPLEQRTMEWQAALYAMPKLYISRYRYESTAWYSLGWTLPAAGVAILALVVGTGLFMAGSVRRSPDA